ncbi:MAG: 3-phosphoserine/phosphohydroxythreonine transaminase [Crocinitomicaceae bacterium]|nr:3-phosphoserine/phosphohydroxythreonine transaminase [Crocinitomicaceae bacterium]|tara:strand:- start:3436 stop:4500 length:1065 start_codon:yes stop_codon:yes gene_type:complete
MSKVHNYSAGPCILPQDVFTEAAKAVTDFNGIGLSILEISHRSKDFVAVMDEAITLVKELLNVPEGYTVLFLQGGASLGFLMSAYNMMPEGGKGAYVETGTWAKKAVKEAKLLGNVEVIASSADKNFNYIPKGYTIPSDADFLHLTSNNTIFGTQMKDFPKSDIPVVCDMSSDIFSRSVNVADFDIIYAGAQKNLGPAGATLYIVKDEVLGRVKRSIPSMLDLKVHAEKDSMFNTPPVYPIYVAMLNLRYMIKEGGLEAQQKKAEERAALLYNEIDSNPLFEGTTAVEDRSNMNATFVLTDESKKDQFDEMWQAANINGLKGHRSVGGYRASMYNALPIESVQVLVDVMKKLNS